MKHCEAKEDFWLLWRRNPDTKDIQFEIHFRPQYPADHERWTREGFESIYLAKGDSVELSTDVETDKPNEGLVELFPDQFELRSDE